MEKSRSEKRLEKKGDKPMVKSAIKGKPLFNCGGRAMEKFPMITKKGKENKHKPSFKKRNTPTKIIDSSQKVIIRKRIL